MQDKYDYKTIEEKWRREWEKDKTVGAKDFSEKPKHYHLIEFPYPSGAGLHVGHCMGYGASDAYARMKRMQGYNVLFPIGWDAFGLPTENYAIKNKIQPSVATKQNIEIFKKQMTDLGYSFDFDREVDTTDPDYYRWTQWIFLQFYKHAIVDGKLIEVADDDNTTLRLAFQSEMPVNWCPSCKIILANEEVIAGKCERCGEQTEKRKQKQWMLRITAYADRLIKDLDSVDYLEQIKTQQINWIGRSEGASIKFKVKSEKKDDDKAIDVFTTRADTLFGCTYVVLAPEHPMIKNYEKRITNYEEVTKYVSDAAKKSDMDRTELAKEKTGVELKGIKAINPINGEEVAVWVADYVLATYGTGAVMAVPAHDARDFEFAKKYGIEIREVIIPKVIDKHDPFIKGVKTVERECVHAIVIDPKTDKVLCLKWKEFPWIGFVIGGIDDGEDIESAAKREVLEETGYKNLKYTKTLGGPVESHFHATHKGENRKGKFTAVVFELINDEKEKVDSSELKRHEPVWLSFDELDKSDMVKPAEHGIFVHRFNHEPESFDDYGVLIDSDEFSGFESDEGKKKIVEKLRESGAGDFAVNYKLRDWIFSRQHYWGEPIPIIHCDKCGIVPMSESELPLKLPEVENYEPTDNGESPLAAISEWVEVKCPRCGSKARRETDTMPNWAGSSWYYLAYTMNNELRSKNYESGENIFRSNQEVLKYWMPVDLYNGGNEHTTLHLLYSRFWNKFLYDLHVVPTSEPYAKRIAHGIILGTDGRKMSKSFGNVINPDEMIKKFGADTLRAYIMFIGPYDKESAWNMDGIMGVYRFINKLWENFKKCEDQDVAVSSVGANDIEKSLNKTIKGVDNDISNFLFNTYIAKLMEFNNILSKEKSVPKEVLKTFVKLIAPAMPFIAEELWHELGGNQSVFTSEWPKFDQALIASEKITVMVQINGKIRDKIEVEPGLPDDELKAKVLDLEIVKSHLKSSTPKKVIIVPDKIVSIVV